MTLIDNRNQTLQEALKMLFNRLIGYLYQET